MTSLGVHSEVGRLRQAIVHRPGLELSRLTPNNIEAMLFDDVLWADRARDEHDLFVAALRSQQVVVHHFAQLLAETLDIPAARDEILDRICSPGMVGPSMVEPLRKQFAADVRIRTEQDWFFHYLLRDDASIDARDRNVFAAAYTSPDALRAGDAWYQAFPQDMIDDDAHPKLTMPVLALGGPGYGWLSYVMPPKAADLKVVRIENSGHFIAEEVPACRLGPVSEVCKLSSRP